MQGDDTAAEVVYVNLVETTLFKDDSDYDDDDDGSFNLDELMEGDFVEVEVIQSGDQYVAVKIEREDESSETKVEAPIEAVSEFESVTIVGALFRVDVGTEYEMNDEHTDADTFFSEVEVGDRAEIKDSDSDGYIEEIEIE